MSGRFRYRRSLASRVIVLTTLAVGLSVAVAALAAYLTVRHQLQASLDESLHARAEVSAQYDPARYPVSKIPAFVSGATDTKVGYILADGSWAMTPGPRHDKIGLGEAELAVARGADSYSCRTISAGGIDYRVATAQTIRAGFALVIAQSLQPNERTLSNLGLVMLIVGGTGVLAAALAGWLVARNGLRPVRNLTHAAEHVARTERLDPIEVEGNDEIARLARAFNAMLLALSASRDRQRQLVADAGHELRTPLTSLRTNLDLLAQAERQGGLPPDSRSELLDDVQFQIAELTTLIGDLTELAREQPTRVMLVEVDFTEVIERAVERVRRRASSLHFDLQVRPWWVIGDPAALERAVTNLLDNAAKWNPPLGVVGVRLREGTLTVTDQGRGIPEADLPHVFERFYRSPESRTLAGSGLGLSIVRQVVERHGGLVRAGRAPGGGALLEMSLPGAASIGVTSEPGDSAGAGVDTGSSQRTLSGG